ncbi:MAG: coenzyme F420-0:L-glutamate ligase [Nitrososphaerales archaeon]
MELGLLRREFKFKVLKTKYWLPGDDYITIITNSIKNHAKDGDILAISEKALSIAKGNIFDELKVKPSSLAKFLSIFWMRICWGYLFSRICHLKEDSILKLRNYPKDLGSRHKQLALYFSGFLQTLRHGSEGGIDVTNLPYSYACLPLKNPQEEVQFLKEALWKRLKLNLEVMIVDTDMTYSLRNFHISPRKSYGKGIVSKGGFLTYILCRALKLKARATPIACSSERIYGELALELAQLSHVARGYGSGKDAWDMAERFKVPLDKVTWSMLKKVKHYPLVLIRRK